MHLLQLLECLGDPLLDLLKFISVVLGYKFGYNIPVGDLMSVKKERIISVPFSADSVPVDATQYAAGGLNCLEGTLATNL